MKKTMIIAGIAIVAAVAVAMVASGLACALGYRTRASALTFALLLAFVAVSDRLAAFTVSKLSPAVMFAVAVGPAGTRLGIDAWRLRRGRVLKRLRPRISARGA